MNLHERLENNKMVINEWLENKIYEITATSFKKIKSSIGARRVDRLNEQEKFVRNLILAYKRYFGEWPIILQEEFH